MPVSISCPKCQTKYSIPDTMAGKPVKCKTCGVTFRTQGSNSKTPAMAGSPNSLSPQDIKKYGIAGQLKRAPEIFSHPPDQSPQAHVLGNFALEDPGFADPEEIKLKSEGKKKELAPVDFTEYSTARVGMNLIFYSLCFLVGFALLTFAFLVIGVLADSAGWTPPERSSTEEPGALVKIIAVLITTFFAFLVSAVPIAGIVACVGQILCITAPQKNEKIAAALVFGTIFASFVVAISGAIVTGAFSAAAESTDNSQVSTAAGAVVGLLELGVFLGAWILSLSSIYFFVAFYRNVGRNIRSRDLVESSRLALIICYATIAISVLGGIGVGVVIQLYPTSLETIKRTVQIASLINSGLGLATMCALIVMVKSGIERTAVRD